MNNENTNLQEVINNQAQFTICFVRKLCCMNLVLSKNHKQHIKTAFPIFKCIHSRPSKEWYFPSLTNELLDKNLINIRILLHNSCRFMINSLKHSILCCEYEIDAQE